MILYIVIIQDLDISIYHYLFFSDAFLPSKRNSEQSICKDILRNLRQASPENNWVCFENVISGESFTADHLINDMKKYVNCILFIQKRENV